MSEYSSILRLLEAERERYTQEVAELERRLKLVRNQISSLDTLISGYLIEEQMYTTQRHLSNLDTTQAFLQDSSLPVDSSESATADSSQDTSVESKTQTTLTTMTQTSSLLDDRPSPIEEESTVTSAPSPDISDIPKLIAPRKSTQVPLLPEFQEYSVQNAILILMRRRPDLHMHIDAVIRDLYGNLSPTELKKARTNVSSALSAGSNQGLWYRVLRAEGVYTLHYEKGVTRRS